MTPIRNLLLKVIVWRIVSIITMLLTLWVLTGDLMESTAVTLVVQVVQTIAHAVFESQWEKVAGE